MLKKTNLQKYKSLSEKRLKEKKLLLADKNRLIQENEFLQSLLNTMASIEEKKSTGGLQELLSRDIMSFLK